jgi:hypothetical protein
MEGSFAVIVGIVLVECALLNDKVNILEHIFVSDKTVTLYASQHSRTQ